MLKYLVVLLVVLAVVPAAKATEPQGDCAGTPSSAAMELPGQLAEWGTLVCTPYGHIISNHEGWIWSHPGGYSPVFVPSQMVRDNPQPLGNASYFKALDFHEVPLSDPGAARALEALEAGLAHEAATNAYRLSVSGSLGRSLVLYFFRLRGSTWGIWCGADGTKCTSDSKFMLLNMRKRS
jgi:hypothetical protein